MPARETGAFNFRELREGLTDKGEPVRSGPSWTQERLAEECGCSKSMISALDTGRSGGSKHLWGVLARALGVTTQVVVAAIQQSKRERDNRLHRTRRKLILRRNARQPQIT